MTNESQSTDAVAAYMTKDVVYVRAEDDVPTAVAAMVDRGVDGAPVVNKDDLVVGMLSASDVMVQGAQVHLPTVISLFGMTAELPLSAARYDHDLTRALASKVADLMQPHPITIWQDQTMSQAATLMHDHDVSRLPVVDHEKHLVGIIARGDVLRYLIGSNTSPAAN